MNEFGYFVRRSWQYWERLEIWEITWNYFLRVWKAKVLWF